MTAVASAQEYAGKVEALYAELRAKRLHVGVGSPARCVTCDVEWPCAASQDVPPHPAVFPPAIVDLIREAVWPDLVPARKRDLRLLDPFAGVGGIHVLRNTPTINGRGIATIGVELMPRWAASSSFTCVGDATDLGALGFGRGYFDAVATSCCYGNRMADHHDNNDTCKACGGRGRMTTGGKRPTFVTCPTCKGTRLSHRRSYRHYYGDTFWDDAPRESNAGAMQWGDEYRELHRAAWAEVERVLRVGGRFVLNVKDHYRDGKRQRVARWHHDTILRMRFVELWRWDVPLDGYGMGANRDARIPTEQVYVFERVS